MSCVAVVANVHPLLLKTDGRRKRGAMNATMAVSEQGLQTGSPLAGLTRLLRRFAELLVNDHIYAILVARTALSHRHLKEFA
jgi:hypothetical protein